MHLVSCRTNEGAEFARNGICKEKRLAVLYVCVCLCTRIGGDMHSNDRLLVVIGFDALALKLLLL